MSRKKLKKNGNEKPTSTQKILLVTAVIQLIRVLIEFIVSLKE